jgi:uncharacterized protein (TIGR00251 family)
MRIKVKVIPGAPKVQVMVISKEELKVKVVSPPDKGKANRELIELLAGHYGVAKSQIRIIRGETSRNKVIEIISPIP